MCSSDLAGDAQSLQMLPVFQHEATDKHQAAAMAAGQLGHRQAAGHIGALGGGAIQLPGKAGAQVNDGTDRKRGAAGKRGD